MSTLTNVSERSLLRSTLEIFRHYGVGVVTKVKNGVAKVEFNPSVFMEPPYRSVNRLYDLAQVEVCDSPLDRLKRAQFDEPWKFELKMLAARLLCGNKGGQLSNARTEILPHQIFAAHRVVSAARRRFLMADEVGLGKTIEAGMIWQALSQRGQANRTLIICPAGLTTQWQEEMQDKFGALFEIYGRDFTAVNPRIWDLKATAIASLDTLKLAEHKRMLLENRKWDLIVFDEAHRLSATNYDSGETKRTLNYKLAEEVRGRQYCEAFLLLTATPHQGDENHSRFVNLLNLLDEKIDFSGLLESGLFDPAGVKFTDLVIRTPKKDVTDAHGKKIFKGRQTHRVSFEMLAGEARLYKEVTAYIRSGFKALEQINDPTKRKAGGFLLTTFQKLNASSTAAIRHALETRLARLKGELTGASTEPEEIDEDERFEGEWIESQALLSESEVIAGEIAEIEGLLAIKVKDDRKTNELISLVGQIGREGPRAAEEKVLIFTEYRQTQRHIVRKLEEKYGKGSCVVIHGGMKLERPGDADRDADAIWEPFRAAGALETPGTKRGAQRLFREHPKVRFLVSTEAGGEGINLQFCHIVVNYDLPWNPMRVEQRVGRCYRYGQDKVVQVYNFFAADTIEDKVAEFFAGRIERAAQAIAKVTGEDPEEIKASLNGQLESEIDPAKLYTRALVEGDLNKQSQAQIDKAVGRAKEAYEIATQSLFRDVSSYSFDKYQKEIATELTLHDVQRFVEGYLGHHRRQLMARDGFLEFLTPDPLKAAGLPERFKTVTFEREQAIKRSDAEFLALGHPFVDQAIKHSGSYDFGGLTAFRRIDAGGDADIAGKRGFLFLFVIRKRVANEFGDECLFTFAPVFVRSDGEIDAKCAMHSVARAAIDDLTDPASPHSPPGADASQAFATAKAWLEEHADVWNWEDDVEFVAAAWCEFK